MAKETVLIGCRLPHGLTIKHPNSDRKGATAKINGMNQSVIKGATYTTTSVDAELWAAWKAAYPDYTPLRTGAIFEARTEDEAKFKGKELAKEKTGLEPLKQEDHGVKIADKN